MSSPPLRATRSDLSSKEFQLEELEDRDECETSLRLNDDGTVTLTADLARRHVEVLLAQGVKAVIDGEPAAIALKRLWPAESAGPAARIPLHERLFGA